MSHIGHDLIIGVEPYRCQVKLEVAGFDDAPVGRIDQDTERIRDRVDRIEESHGEMFHVDGRLIVDLDHFHVFHETVFFQFFADQGTGKTRCIDRFDIHGAKQEGDASDVVFVSVCDDKYFTFAVVFDQMSIIWNDIIDTEQIVLWKTNAGIDDQDLVAVLKTICVLTNLSQSADSVDESIVFFNCCFIIFISKTT